mgnify:CR=1 FL=1
MNEFLKDLLPRVEKMRADTAATCCENIFVTDGTVTRLAIPKETGLAMVANYDALISTIKSRVEMAEADQPSQQP